MYRKTHRRDSCMKGLGVLDEGVGVVERHTFREVLPAARVNKV